MLQSNKGVFASSGMKESAMRLGMRWFIGSLTVFLLASVLAIVVIRLQVTQWPVLPPVPQSLWWSTGVLLLSTLALQKVKKEWNPLWVWLAILFGVFFLGLQLLAAMQWHQDLAAIGYTDEVVAIAQMALYVLIFLHGVHVIGGLFPLGFVITKHGYEKYKSVIPLLVTYWHFVFCIWIVFFTTILLLRN